MFISIGRRLRGLGGVRVGIRMSGSKGCFYVGLFLCINAFIYLFWYTMLATFWLMYGMCYLFFYLPIKGIIKLCKKKKMEKEIEDAGRKYAHTYSSSTDTNSSDFK